MRQAATLGFERWTVGLAVLGAAGLAYVMLRFPGGLAICSAVVLCLLLVSLTRFDLTNLTIAFLVSQPAIGFLKRAIFLLGPQPTRVYHAIQGVCTLLFLLMLATAIRHLTWQRLPRSGRILAAYLALAWLTTLFVPGPPWYERTVALLTRALPPTAFYVGLAMGLGGLLRIGRVALVLVFVSVAYGLFHFAYGPSPVEEAWAAAMKDSSLQAGKLYAHIARQRFLGEIPEFRVFSFYSNALDWGLFLLSSFVMILLLRTHNWVTKSTLWWGVVGVVGGLVLTLSRSPSAGLLVMLGTLRLLRLRFMQHPWALVGLIAAGFAAVIEGGNLLIASFGDVVLPDSIVLKRFMTVGTLEDRVHAWELLRYAAKESWLIGRGYGQAWFLVNQEVDEVMVSHNFVVDLVLYVGLPGFLLFVAFYIQWLRESIDASRAVQSETTVRTIHLIVAFSVGFMSIGLFSSDRFLTYEFFMILGALSGWLTSLTRTVDVRQA